MGLNQLHITSLLQEKGPLHLSEIFEELYWVKRDVIQKTFWDMVDEGILALNPDRKACVTAQ